MDCCYFIYPPLPIWKSCPICLPRYKHSVVRINLISFVFLTLVSSAIFVTGDGQPLPTEPPEGGGGEGLEKLPPLPEDDDVFIAFARVFSGCLRKSTSVYVLGPKHDPALALQKVLGFK